MPSPLNLVGAELVDRTGQIELVFRDPVDGAEWRVAVRTIRQPVLPPESGPSNGEAPLRQGQVLPVDQRPAVPRRRP